VIPKSNQRQFLYVWSLLAPTLLFSAYVQTLYVLAEYPLHPVRSIVPSWISIGVFLLCLLIGYYPMIKLARSGTFGRGVLVLYVLAMLFVMTFGSVWIACRNGDCF
jgi:hypothetical protein